MARCWRLDRLRSCPAGHRRRRKASRLLTSLGDLVMRKSIPATFAAGIAATLVIGSGTALATTGGAFLLGHSNTVKATTTLTNTHGIPLALKAKGGRPAFSVNSKALVPNLDAELLDGRYASDFLAANGQASDSARLGGKDVSSFLP